VLALGVLEQLQVRENHPLACSSALLQQLLMPDQLPLLSAHLETVFVWQRPLLCQLVHQPLPWCSYKTLLDLDSGQPVTD
jgi:hypothetical protein